MFASKVSLSVLSAAGEKTNCPIPRIDHFAMRNCTNDALFDDTMPVAEGLLEIGYRLSSIAYEQR